MKKYTIAITSAALALLSMASFAATIDTSKLHCPMAQSLPAFDTAVKADDGTWTVSSHSDSTHMNVKGVSADTPTGALLKATLSKDSSYREAYYPGSISTVDGEDTVEFNCKYYNPVSGYEITASFKQ